jgi:hypothetical protein
MASRKKSFFNGERARLGAFLGSDLRFSTGNR